MVCLRTGQRAGDRVMDEGEGEGAGEGVGAAAGDEGLVWGAMVVGDGERGARIVSGRVLGAR